MTDQSLDFEAALIKLIPQMRAYAIKVTRPRDLGDDLVQDTLVRALRSRHTFVPGTNLKAWIFTILRNGFLTTLRRKRLEPAFVQDDDLESPAAQDHAVALCDVSRLMQQLPTNQREALLMVGAKGHSYKEAAAIAGTNIGTVKSRVSRARAFLQPHFSAAALETSLPPLP